LEDWKIKISVLWLVWECAAIVTPILEQYIPGFIEEALAEIKPELLLILAIVMLIAPVMAFLSLTLKNSINRWANIIVGIVFAGIGLAGVSEAGLAEPSNRAYFASVIPIGIVEIVVAALIVWYAWKSKQKA